jgi:hypothetical protein
MLTSPLLALGKKQGLQSFRLGCISAYLEPRLPPDYTNAHEELRRSN